jgi:hypothetical protein
MDVGEVGYECLNLIKLAKNVTLLFFWVVMPCELVCIYLLQP